MADLEVSGSASPVPSDHKRKLDDLDSEPFDQPLTDSNGNSLPATDGDGDRDTATIDVKRPRIDVNSDSAGMLFILFYISLLFSCYVENDVVLANCDNWYLIVY